MLPWEVLRMWRLSAVGLPDALKVRTEHNYCSTYARMRTSITKLCLEFPPGAGCGAA